MAELSLGNELTPERQAAFEERQTEQTPEEQLLQRLFTENNRRGRREWLRSQKRVVRKNVFGRWRRRAKLGSNEKAFTAVMEQRLRDSRRGHA